MSLRCVGQRCFGDESASMSAVTPVRSMMAQPSALSSGDRLEAVTALIQEVMSETDVVNAAASGAKDDEVVEKVEAMPETAGDDAVEPEPKRLKSADDEAAAAVLNGVDAGEGEHNGDENGGEGDEPLLPGPKEKMLAEAKAAAQTRAAEIMAAASAGQSPAITAMKQEQRPACRLYVGSLHYDLKEADVRNVFAPFGRITSIDMSFEPMTGKHKGYCFVEFAEPQSAVMALETMNGFQLAGRAIKVGRPTAVGTGSQGATTGPPRKFQQQQQQGNQFGGGGMNFMAQMQAQAQIQAQLALLQHLSMNRMGGGMAGGMGAGMQLPGATSFPGQQGMGFPQANSLAPNSLGGSFGAGALGAHTAAPTGGVTAPAAAKPAGATRLYIGSVPFDVNQATMTQLFTCFGRVKSCTLLPDPTNPMRHRGYGFVEFEDANASTTALNTMNGFELLGRPLKVAWASNPGTGGAAAATPVVGSDAVRVALESLKKPGL